MRTAPVNTVVKPQALNTPVPSTWGSHLICDDSAGQQRAEDAREGGEGVRQPHQDAGKLRGYIQVVDGEARPGEAPDPHSDGQTGDGGRLGHDVASSHHEDSLHSKRWK